LSLEFENCKKNDHLIVLTGDISDQETMIQCVNCWSFYDRTTSELLAKQGKKNE